jgi:signal peptidase I
MENTGKTKDQINHPRVPWKAGILSLFLPGLGQFYCGQVKRGVYFFILYIFIFAGSMFLFLIPVPLFPEIFIVSTLFAIYIYAINDAAKIARNNKEFYYLKKNNKWYLYITIYLASGFFVEPVAILIKGFTIQAYKIPSGSMKNTLLVGDHIVISKSSYGLKSHDQFVFDNFSFFPRTPERGDVIVFKYPKNEQRDFVKRVVGLPGEKIQIIRQKVFINDQLLKSKLYVNHQEPPRKNAFFPRDDFGPFMVPPDHLFVLGDNRDKSQDSRYFGPIDINKVKGKVIRIYWSWDPDENWVRFERIGKLIQ